jgi:hypothetical protein
MDYFRTDKHETRLCSFTQASKISGQKFYRCIKARPMSDKQTAFQPRRLVGMVGV